MNTSMAEALLAIPLPTVLYHAHSCLKGKVNHAYQTEQLQVFYIQILCYDGMQAEYMF